MSVEVSGDDVDWETLEFRPLQVDARIKVFDAFGQGEGDGEEPIGTRRVGLLAVSNAIGVVAVGGDSGFALAKVDDLRRVLKTAEKGALVERCDKVVRVDTRCRTRGVAFDKDGEHVLVYGDDGKMRVFEVETVLRKAGGGPKYVVDVGDAVEIRPNPEAMPQSVAVLDRQGGVTLYTAGESPVDLRLKDVTTVAWSPKGKQLAVGLKDGTIVQVTPEGTEKNRIPPPKELGLDGKVDCLVWLENAIFVAIYGPDDPASQDSRPTYIVEQTKTPQNTKATSYTRLNDPIWPDSDRSSRYFVEPIRQLGGDVKYLLTVSNINAVDFGFIGCSKESNTWANWTLDEGKGISMPLDENEENSWIVGMAMDFTSQEGLKPETEDLPEGPPVPVLWAMNCRGWVWAYNVVDRKAVEGGEKCGEMTVPREVKVVETASGGAKAFSFGGATSGLAPAGGVFGAATKPGGLFGTSAATAQGGDAAKPTQGLFGGALAAGKSGEAPKPAGSLFGAPTSSTKPAGLFGVGAAKVGEEAKPAGGLFGGASALTKPAGLFGLGGANSAPTFGNTAGKTSATTAAGPTSSNVGTSGNPPTLFGAPSSGTAATKAAGTLTTTASTEKKPTGGLLGAPAAAKTGIFGAATKPAVTTGAKLFGGPTAAPQKSTASGPPELKQLTDEELAKPVEVPEDELYAYFDSVIKQHQNHLDAFGEGLRDTILLIKGEAQPKHPQNDYNPDNWALSDCRHILPMTKKVLRRLQGWRSKFEDMNRSHQQLTLRTLQAEGQLKDVKERLRLAQNPSEQERARLDKLGPEDAEMREKILKQKRGVEMQLKRVRDVLSELEGMGARHHEQLDKPDWATICYATHKVTRSTQNTVRKLDEIENRLKPLERIKEAPAKPVMAVSATASPKKIQFKRPPGAYGLFPAYYEAMREVTEPILPTRRSITRNVTFRKLFRNKMDAITRFQIPHVNRRLQRVTEDFIIKDPEILEIARRSLNVPPGTVPKDENSPSVDKILKSVNETMRTPIKNYLTPRVVHSRGTETDDLEQDAIPSSPTPAGKGKVVEVSESTPKVVGVDENQDEVGDRPLKAVEVSSALKSKTVPPVSTGFTPFTAAAPSSTGFAFGGATGLKTSTPTTPTPGKMSFFGNAAAAAPVAFAKAAATPQSVFFSKPPAATTGSPLVTAVKPAAAPGVPAGMFGTPKTEPQAEVQPAGVETGEESGEDWQKVEREESADSSRGLGTTDSETWSGRGDSPVLVGDNRRKSAVEIPEEESDGEVSTPVQEKCEEEVTEDVGTAVQEPQAGDEDLAGNDEAPHAVEPVLSQVSEYDAQASEIAQEAEESIPTPTEETVAGSPSVEETDQERPTDESVASAEVSQAEKANLDDDATISEDEAISAVEATREDLLRAMSGGSLPAEADDDEMESGTGEAATDLAGALTAGLAGLGGGSDTQSGEAKASAFGSGTTSFGGFSSSTSASTTAPSAVGSTPAPAPTGFGGFGSGAQSTSTGFGTSPARTAAFGAVPGTSTGFGQSSTPATTSAFGGGTSGTSTGFGQSSTPATTSAFGGSTSGTSTGFGQSSTPATTTAFGGSTSGTSTGFGQSSTPATTTAFGGSTSAFGTSGFGQTPATTKTSAFGSAPAASFGSTGFGSAPATTGFGSSAGTGFGSSPAQPAFGNTGFGSGATGAGGFGSMASAVGVSFGQNAQLGTGSPAAGNAFAANASPFASMVNSVKSSSSGFGSYAQKPTGFAAFAQQGQQQQQQQPSGFASFAQQGQQQQQLPSGFAAAAAQAPQQSTGFGAAPTAQPQQAASGFGAFAQQQGGFGGGASNVFGSGSNTGSVFGRSGFGGNVDPSKFSGYRG
ncbi:hypothetical protein HDU85_003872 [Gaertneriomyces sp. JEL0708]|nr:hypothetical protein HDU85_003872 [Gaertneriomyces sp. JEL0708]